MSTKLIQSENRIIQPPNAAVDALISRAAQEVQAMVAMAKRFPRDEDESIKRILTACKRPHLADVAEYEYPRGDTRVTGPSIRLAEVLAMNWQNFEHGTIEIEQQGNSTLMCSFAWDYERNTRCTKQFKARHIREKKSGNQLLTEPRDIYEAIANFAARRTRACILALIPIEVQDLALMECQQTVMEADKRPPKQQIEEMLAKFARIQVTAEMLRMRLRHKVADCTPREILGLRKIYNAIVDQIGSVSDYFVVDDPKRPASSKAGQSKTERMAAEVKAQSEASGSPQAQSEPETVQEPPEPDKEPWEKAQAPRKGKSTPVGMSERIKTATQSELHKIGAALDEMPDGPEKEAFAFQLSERWKAIFEEEKAKEREPGDEE